MKNVYVFCSFAVVMLVMAVSLFLLHSEIRDLRQELSDTARLQEQEMSQQNLRMELVESSLERIHDALAADEQTGGNGEDAQDAAVSVQEKENNGANETAGVQENTGEQYLTGYDIRLTGNVIYVYTAGEEEPMITLPVSQGYLTEEQMTLLKQGIHIEDMQEVYHMLESYSS